jgi:hypothetical protein
LPQSPYDEPYQIATWKKNVLRVRLQSSTKPFDHAVEKNRRLVLENGESMEQVNILRQKLDSYSR